MSVKEYYSNNFINLTDFIYKIQLKASTNTPPLLSNYSDVLLNNAEALTFLSNLC